MDSTSVIGTKNKKGQVYHRSTRHDERGASHARPFLPAAKSLKKPSGAPTSM